MSDGNHLTPEREAEIRQRHAQDHEGSQSYLDMDMLLEEIDRLRTPASLKERIDVLSEDERRELLSDWCGVCYGPAPCHCWNDE